MRLIDRKEVVQINNVHSDTRNLVFIKLKFRLLGNQDNKRQGTQSVPHCPGASNNNNNNNSDQNNNNINNNDENNNYNATTTK